MEDNVKFLVCGDVKTPTRSAGQDAGIDIYMPNLTEKFMEDLTAKNPGHPFRWGIVGAPDKDNADGKSSKGLYLYIAPHEDLLIPSYLRTRIGPDIYLKISNKSGVSTKQKLMVVADTVDSSYEGISHIHVVNYSNSMRFIEFGQKLAQIIPVKIDSNPIDVWYDESCPSYKDMKNQTTAEKFFEGHGSSRGEGGFGSTGLGTESSPDKATAETTE